MAKKVLTPEQQEIKAIKKEKRGQNWTKFWAIFLALVLTLAIAFAGKTTGEKLTGGTATAATTAAPVEETTLPKDENAIEEGETVTNAEGETIVGLSKADAVKLLNDATAKAAGKSYDWKRTCSYTRAVDVGNATNTLNTVIHTVDPNASLDTVVGGFIGIGDKSGKGASGKIKDAEGEEQKENYVFKKTALAEADLTDYQQVENTYTFVLSKCDNPQKDGKNSLHHVTNDFITHNEVDSGIKDALGGSGAIALTGSNVAFSNIKVVATIVNGELKSLEISYDFDATLNLKALLPITGTGAAKTVITYSNFA